MRSHLYQSGEWPRKLSQKASRLVTNIDTAVVGLVVEVLPPESGGEDERKRGNKYPESSLGRVTHPQYVRAQITVPNAHDVAVTK